MKKENKPIAQEEVLLSIAKEFLYVETLEKRNRDCLDFHSIGVGQLRRALQAAYVAGQNSVSIGTNTDGN